MEFFPEDFFTKEFFNILVALAALTLVVACKPAGNAGAKLKRHAQEDVDPVNPFNPEPMVDGDPEEILAEEGFAWHGTNSLSQVGFFYDKERNRLYLNEGLADLGSWFLPYGTWQHNQKPKVDYKPWNFKEAWQMISSEVDFTELANQKLDSNNNLPRLLVPVDGKPGVFKFTIAVSKYFYMVLMEDKQTIKICRNSNDLDKENKGQIFKKVYLDTFGKSAKTAQVTALTQENTYWFDPVTKLCCAFRYDEADSRIHADWSRMYMYTNYDPAEKQMTKPVSDLFANLRKDPSLKTKVYGLVFANAKDGRVFEGADGYEDYRFTLIDENTLEWTAHRYSDFGADDGGKPHEMTIRLEKRTID